MLWVSCESVVWHCGWFGMVVDGRDWCDCVVDRTVVLAWPCGAMDNASDYGSEDSRFESWQGRQHFFRILIRHPIVTPACARVTHIRSCHAIREPTRINTHSHHMYNSHVNMVIKCEKITTND